MPNYKEIARLKAAGQSNRAIADFLGLSRNTVNAAVARIEDSGLRFENLQILTDAQINEVFPSTSGRKIEGEYYMYNFNDYNAVTLDQLVGGVSQLWRYGIDTISPLMAKPKYSNDRIKHQSAVFMVFPNTVYDYRSQTVVLGKRVGDESKYLMRFSLTEAEEQRLVYIRKEPEIYRNPFGVTSETLRSLFDYYDTLFPDFTNDSELGINPKYNFLFKDRFSICNSIQEMSEETISNTFVSIIIESKYRKKMIEDLAVIGIDKAFVFPELEYSAERVINLLF